MWLRRTIASTSLLGSAGEQWGRIVAAAASGLPRDFHDIPLVFSLDDRDFDVTRHSHEKNMDYASLTAHGRHPVTTAWWKLSWAAAIEEVARRYPELVRFGGLRERLVVDWYKAIFGTALRRGPQSVATSDDVRALLAAAQNYLPPDERTTYDKLDFEDARSHQRRGGAEITFECLRALRMCVRPEIP